MLGATAAGLVLYTIAMGKPGFTPGGFASNGYGPTAPGATAWARLALDANFRYIRAVATPSGTTPSSDLSVNLLACIANA